MAMLMSQTRGLEEEAAAESFSALCLFVVAFGLSLRFMVDRQCC